jgi:hypothetical protein
MVRDGLAVIAEAIPKAIPPPVAIAAAKRLPDRVVNISSAARGKKEKIEKWKIAATE